MRCNDVVRVIIANACPIFGSVLSSSAVRVKHGVLSDPFLCLINECCPAHFYGVLMSVIVLHVVFLSIIVLDGVRDVFCTDKINI